MTFLQVWVVNGALDRVLSLNKLIFILHLRLATLRRGVDVGVVEYDQEV